MEAIKDSLLGILSSVTCALLLVGCFRFSDAQPIDYRYACLDSSNGTLTNPYKANLNTLISSLASHAENSDGFHNTSIGTQTSNNIVHGLYLCRGDANTSLCHSCIQNSSSLILQHCPNNASAIIWYPFCLLRYSNKNFFGNVNTIPTIPMVNNKSEFYPEEFDSDARMLMNGLIQTASETPLMFGTHGFNINGTEKRYGWVQCSRDISSEGCRTCLSSMLDGVEVCCEGKRVWRIFSPSCIVMYETQPFNLTDMPLSQPQPGSKRGKNKTRILIISTTCGSMAVALAGFCICYLWPMHGKEKDSQHIQADGLKLKASTVLLYDHVGKEEESVDTDLPMMHLNEVLNATGHFSDESKLGGGGFGPVYKGVLPDGSQIAVKRLSRTSSQGVQEFKNEVTVIAKLQHRNLVRILACCIEQDEKLVIYEYMPNLSLDFHLFDKVEGTQLNWKQRLGIINGIVKGILYLHEDSRLRVIHRDLKASNILLDQDMNPKISDFGLARTFGDESQTNTRRVVGTYGYMAPEYAMEGLFSVKSDVFSFGVLLLEIISGKKNKGFYLSEHGQSLPLYVWNLWHDGKGLELMDPLLENSFIQCEVLKCIHIALLCVQDDAADRPTMSAVVVMLASDTMTLPKPRKPAFSVGRVVAKQGYIPNNSMFCSINEVTVSNVAPR